MKNVRASQWIAAAVIAAAVVGLALVAETDDGRDSMRGSCAPPAIYSLESKNRLSSNDRRYAASLGDRPLAASLLVGAVAELPEGTLVSYQLAQDPEQELIALHAEGVATALFRRANRRAPIEMPLLKTAVSAMQGVSPKLLAGAPGEVREPDAQGFVVVRSERRGAGEIHRTRVGYASLHDPSVRHEIDDSHFVQKWDERGLVAVEGVEKMTAWPREESWIANAYDLQVRRVGERPARSCDRLASIEEATARLGLISVPWSESAAERRRDAAARRVEGTDLEALLKSLSQSDPTKKNEGFGLLIDWLRAYPEAAGSAARRIDEAPHDRDFVRGLIAAFAESGTPEGKRELLALLDSRRDPFVLEQAIVAHHSVREPTTESLDRLMSLYGDSRLSSELRAFAALAAGTVAGRADGRAGAPVIKTLIGALERGNGDRLLLLEALGNSGDRSVLDTLLKATAGARDEHTAVVAVQAMRHIRDPRAREALLGTLETKNPHARQVAALSALGWQILDARAVERLLGVYRRAPDSGLGAELRAKTLALLHAKGLTRDGPVLELLESRRKRPEVDLAERELIERVLSAASPARERIAGAGSGGGPAF